MANIPTNIMDFRGFDTNTIFISRGGIVRPIGNFPEGLSQAILVGTMLVGRLGVGRNRCNTTPQWTMNNMIDRQPLHTAIELD